jgi:hypothetical protein
VSFETSFETTETGTETSFGTIRNKMFFWIVSLLEPKKTEDQPKQFDKEHILLFLQKISGFFRFFCFFLFFFSLFQNSLFRLFRFYTETESFDVSIE